MLVGDSHAINLYGVLASSGRWPFVVGVVRPGCRPQDAREDCRFDAITQFAGQGKQYFSLLMFHQSGAFFIPTGDSGAGADAVPLDDAAIRSAASYLDGLSAAFGGPVIWLGPRTEYRHDPRAVLTEGAPTRLPDRSDRDFAVLDGVLAEIAQSGRSYRYLSFSSVFSMPDDLLVEDCFLFRDQDHFSRCGERYLGRQLRRSEADPLFPPAEPGGSD